MICPEVGRIDPDHVVGVHVTQLFSFPSGDPAELADLTAEEQAELETLQWFYENKMSFNPLMAQQPQTLAYALLDSPVGLLAWNAQLFGEDLDADFVLTNVDALLADRHRRLGGAALLRERARHAADRADHGPARAGRRSAATSAASAASPSATTRTSSTGRRSTTAATSRPTRCPDLLVPDVREFYRGLR